MKLWWRRRREPANHPFTNLKVRGDWRGVPTTACPCGCETFYVVAWFNDLYTLAGYLTCGLCADCGALVTVATEIDHFEYERY